MSGSGMSHKTVFLLDHSFQMKELSGVLIQLDLESRGAGSSGASSSRYFPSVIPTISKSLWTSVVESTLEYARILWDIYGHQRLLRMLLSNPQSTETVNGWSREQQNMNYILEHFANAGPPLKNMGSVQNGLKAAVAALQEPSELQEELMNANKCSYQIANKGRVVCFTSHHLDADLSDYFHSVLNEQNKAIAGSKFSLPVQECEFTLISLYPMGKERKMRISTRTCHEVSSILRAEAYVVPPDRLYDKVIELCMRHHDLVVTSVTGIPMKEEQNSTSSSNYDVALLHPRMPTTSVDTSTLRWSAQTTQKGAGLGQNPCTSSCRITPVDVNSRPSTCLSNFVISGRSVWLDMCKKGKSISHVLTSHGGEMWMHIMETSRNILEDPPSISEGIGGRVTDYRIPDFVEFMKLNLLAPYEEPNPVLNRGSSKSPNEMAKERLARKSAYWPITISGSLLFPMAVHIESLLNIIPRDTMTEMEKVECDSKLFALMAIEARGDPPPIPSPHHKKGHKRDEQWRSVYNELESFIRANLHSENHRKVLDCFLGCRQQEEAAPANGKAEKRGKDSIMDLTMTDSPMSPPPVKKAHLEESGESGAPVKMNILDLWRKITEKKDLRALPQTLKLYPNLRADEVKLDKSGKDRRDRESRQDKSVN